MEAAWTGTRAGRRPQLEGPRWMWFFNTSRQGPERYWVGGLETWVALRVGEGGILLQEETSG